MEYLIHEYPSILIKIILLSHRIARKFGFPVISETYFWVNKFGFPLSTFDLVAFDLRNLRYFQMELTLFDIILFEKFILLTESDQRACILFSKIIEL